MTKAFEIILGLLRVIIGLAIVLWIMVFFYTHAFAIALDTWDSAIGFFKNPDVWTAMEPWPKD